MSIVVGPVFYESHMHTTLCKHAEGTLVEYAQVTVQRGLRGMTVTCHCPPPDGIDQGGRISPGQIREYVEIVKSAAVCWQGRLDIRLGLECDFAPEFVPWLEDLLDSQDFSYVLGSVHPFANYYQKAYLTEDPLAYQQLYFRHLAEAAESGLCDCLSHPDWVKYFKATEWNFPAIAEDIASSLDRIAATGVSMELNTRGRRLGNQDFSPCGAQLALMSECNITVVLGADAHEASSVGDLFLEALEMLQNVGYTQVSIYLDRQKHDLDIQVVRDSLTAVLSTEN